MAKIEVHVQRADRLKAITKLCSAIELVAKALSTPVEVDISGCTINSCDCGIHIDTSEDVTETIIKEVKGEENGTDSN